MSLRKNNFMEWPSFLKLYTNTIGVILDRNSVSSGLADCQWKAMRGLLHRLEVFMIWDVAVPGWTFSSESRKLQHNTGVNKNRGIKGS